MVDPIQKALLRAQEERRAQSAEVAPQEEPEVAPTAVPDGPIDLADTVVRRSDTEVVRLDPQHLRRHCILTGETDDPLAGPFDLLRTKVMQQVRANGWRTLAVLSADEGEGKTVAAINLALSIAKLPSHTAMLLDMDLRRPGLLRTLGHTPQYGIDDWLAGKAAFSQTLFSPITQRLLVSGVRTPMAGAAEALASNRVAGQIEEVATRYDDRVIVIDMPSMLHSDDALVLIPKIDCFLFVVAAGQSLGHRVKECLPLIPRDRFLGTVLNKSLR